MRENYSNYGFDDIFMRTFMMPAVMPGDINKMNDNNKFLEPKEGFLRGNMETNSYIPYKNMTYLKPNILNERENALYQIQETSFAAHDINLYLDTNPNDTNAIRLYNEYNNGEKMLIDAYERKYGPINLSDTNGLSMTPWAWIKEPWPWNE